MTLSARSPRRPTPPPAAAQRTPTLDATCRCTRCGSQAFTVYERATLSASDDPVTGFEASIEVLSLLFCAHHSREHHDALLDQGFAATTDETWRLTPSG